MYFFVGREGFEPPNSMRTDLQSVSFNHLHIYPDICIPYGIWTHDSSLKGKWLNPLSNGTFCSGMRETRTLLLGFYRPGYHHNPSRFFLNIKKPNLFLSDWVYCFIMFFTHYFIHITLLTDGTLYPASYPPIASIVMLVIVVIFSIF